MLGGSGFSVMPAELMARLRPDYGISGEGEDAFPQFVDALECAGEWLERGNLHRLAAEGVESIPAPASTTSLIVDSVFLPRTLAKRVCRELIDRNWSVPWTCYTNSLGFDVEMAELAVEAGCVGMEVGSDSGCDHILKRLRKGFTTDHIRKLHDISTGSFHRGLFSRPSGGRSARC